jgi:hypothetical protein
MDAVFIIMKRRLYNKALVFSLRTSAAPLVSSPPFPGGFFFDYNYLIIL